LGQGIELTRRTLLSSLAVFRRIACQNVNPDKNQTFSTVRLSRDRVLWKTRNFYNLLQKALAWRETRAYIASSRRPDGLSRGPRNGPEAILSALSWVFLVFFGSPKKLHERRLTGKRRGAYTPRLTQTGRA
jgi:hypothetical protein